MPVLFFVYLPESGLTAADGKMLQVFEQTHVEEANGTFYEFELVGCKCVGTYVRNKRNQNQVCWLWKKVPSDGPAAKSFQKFLDTQQYTATGILRYERIFGEGFVSTGGMGEGFNILFCFYEYCIHTLVLKRIL